MNQTTHQSANLEIHICDHCNLRCVACSHESPFATERFDDPATLRLALKALWRHYEAPLIKLLGGEPLLHPDIGAIIEAVRAVTGSRIRIVTNGLLLKKRHLELRGVDEIHISAYPGIRLPTQGAIREIASQIRVPITLQRFDHFRWHRAPRPHAPELTKLVFDTCQMYHDWQCHTLREGRFYPCPALATWARETEESVDLLAGDKSVAAGLQRLLDRDAPLRGCATCLGSAGERLRHQQHHPRQLEQASRTGTLDEPFLSRLEVDPEAWNDCYEYEYTVHPNGEVEHSANARR